MRVAVIVVSMLMVAALSEASRSWMSKTEARPVQTTVQTPLVDRWVDIESTQLPLVARKDDIAAQVTPPPLSEPNPEPRGMVLVLVFITITLTLAIIEVLFRVEHGADREDKIGRRPKIWPSGRQA
jgi:hypothetical protein